MLVIPQKLPSEHVCSVCDRGVTVKAKLRPQMAVAVVRSGKPFDWRVKLQNTPGASDATAKQSNFPQTGKTRLLL